MLRIVKRTELTRTQSYLFRFAAIVLSLVASGVFIIALGHNPLDVYAGMLKGALGNTYKRQETIIQAIPLIITSFGIVVAFKMKFWNIGAEGQIMMGAFGASYFALNYSGMPKPLLLVVMALAGMICGGIWALVPALFKAQFGTNETLFTLMMNYIALKWIIYLQYSLWKDPAAHGFPKIAMFSEQAFLPKVFGIHIGWIIAIILAVVMYIFLKHSKKGYEIAVIGESINTAKYAGMNVKKIIITAVFISGGLCGLTGMIQVSGVNHTLDENISNGLGYTAIITTWLGQLSTVGIVVVSLLFAVLVRGGSYIQTIFQIPSAAASMLQGMILFFVLGSEFFLQYKIILKADIFKKFKKEGI